MKEQDIAKAVGLAAAGAALVAVLGWIFTNAPISPGTGPGATKPQLTQGLLGSFTNPYPLPAGAYYSEGVIYNIPAGSPVGWYQTPSGPPLYWTPGPGPVVTGPPPPIYPILGGPTGTITLPVRPGS